MSEIEMNNINLTSEAASLNNEPQVNATTTGASNMNNLNFADLSNLAGLISQYGYANTSAEAQSAGSTVNCVPFQSEANFANAAAITAALGKGGRFDYEPVFSMFSGYEEVDASRLVLFRTTCRYNAAGKAVGIHLLHEDMMRGATGVAESGAHANMVFGCQQKAMILQIHDSKIVNLETQAVVEYKHSMNLPDKKLDLRVLLDPDELELQTSELCEVWAEGRSMLNEALFAAYAKLGVGYNKPLALFGIGIASTAARSTGNRVIKDAKGNAIGGGGAISTLDLDAVILYAGNPLVVFGEKIARANRTRIGNAISNRLANKAQDVVAPPKPVATPAAKPVAVPASKPASTPAKPATAKPKAEVAAPKFGDFLNDSVYLDGRWVGVRPAHQFFTQVAPNSFSISTAPGVEMKITSMLGDLEAAEILIAGSAKSLLIPDMDEFLNCFSHPDCKAQLAELVTARTIYVDHLWSWLSTLDQTDSIFDEVRDTDSAYVYDSIGAIETTATVVVESAIKVMSLKAEQALRNAQVAASEEDDEDNIAPEGMYDLSDVEGVPNAVSNEKPSAAIGIEKPSATRRSANTAQF